MHALMLGVMVVAMLAHSALASIAGAVLLVAVSVPCAALSRARPFLRAHVVDLWAMALVMLALLPRHGVPDQLAVPHTSGTHVSGHLVSGHLAAVVTFAVIALAWAGARVWLGTTDGARRAAAASGSLTAAGLAAMAVFCA